MSRNRWIAAIVTVVIAVLAPLAVIASDRFTDVTDDNVFHDDIGWLADAGVTKGCNPPTNDLFCPGDPVTRQQMSAFMRRFSQYIDAEDGTPATADHATTADNATTVGGMAVQELTTEARGDVLTGWLEGGGEFLDADTAMVLGSIDLTDAGGTHALVSYHANLYGNEGSNVTLWLSGDDSCDITSAAGSVEGSGITRDVAPDALDTLSGSFVVDAAAVGTVNLCLHTDGGSVGVFGSALNALVTTTGSISVRELPPFGPN